MFLSFFKLFFCATDFCTFVLFLLEFDLDLLIWILNPPVCQIEENVGFGEFRNCVTVHAVSLRIFYGNSEFKWDLDCHENFFCSHHMCPGYAETENCTGAI